MFLENNLRSVGFASLILTLPQRVGMFARQSRIVRRAHFTYSAQPVRHLSRGLATLAEVSQTKDVLRKRKKLTCPLVYRK